MVISFHGDHTDSFGRGKEWLLRGLFRRGDAFIANSDFTRGELLRLGCPQAKIHTIPAIVDDSPDASARVPTRSDSFHVVTVARLDAAKGIQCALKAIHELREQGMMVHYTVAGDGPYSASLRSLAHELRIADQVNFVGWLAQDEVSGLYKEADVVILPTVGQKRGWNETQGLVLQEAQLHGVPVIGSDNGGIPESLDFGRAGILFRSGDPSDLARALARISSEPALVQKLTRHARTYVRSKYVAPVVIPRLIGLYESLLQRNGVRESRS
jgi:glycosyltransferase involved in cell wall biosynthesis